VRTVFLGSPPFATPVLARLADSAHAPLALVTPPDRPRGRGRVVEESELVTLARERGIAVIATRDPHADEVLQRLRALEPEVLVVASYGVTLKASLLELAPLGCLNVHASLLPRHRGASPIQAAILAGDDETGVSIQRVVRALDAGDVLLERRRPIGPRETGVELFDALAALGAEALVEALDLLASVQAVFTPQDPALVTHCRKLTGKSGRIDWTRPADELERLVRAMTPWPGARARVPAKRGAAELTVTHARIVEPHEPSAGGPPEPGELLEAGGRFVVATGTDPLELERVVPAGKREMEGAEYLRGARLAPGERLPPFEPDDSKG
jgi:methionyl-tRNA formyltransferase